VRTSEPPESSGSGETGGGEIWGSGEDLTQTIHGVANARLVQAASVWATAFGVDPEFWLEKQFGHRICAWVDQALSNDAKAFGDTPELRDELIRRLDFMTSAGVAQAHELEMGHRPER
jgi:hypothetical protein